MVDTSIIDDMRAGGFEPKSAEAISKAIHEAVRSSLNAERHPSSSARNADWRVIGVAVASVCAILGFLHWETISFRDYFRDLRDTEVGSLNARPESLQDDMRAEIGSFREEVNALREQVSALGERTARVEAVIQERLPAAP